MSTNLGKAYVDVDADLRKFTRGVGSKVDRVADSAGKRFNKRFSSHMSSDTFKALGKGALVAGAAIGVGLAVEIKKSVAAFRESEKVQKQTQAVLKSTGGQAGVTAKQVDKLATAISQKTGIDDEAVASSENLLLTFRNVRNEAGKGNKVFDRSTRLIQDMSVALGQDSKSSAIQLGKALNDPIKGVTALQRVGVSFTAQQRDQIKTLVESGKTLQAQKLILAEVEKEFGGSAAAQAQPIDKLKVAVGNIQEAIGSGFKPAVDSVETSLTHLAVKALPTAQKAADDVAKVFGRKDLDLGEKFQISTKHLKRDVKPFVTQLGNELKAADLGEKLGDAIDAGVPKIADAAAAAAPHAAAHFVTAFKNASVWGQLITAAFLASKLGAFRGAGGAAAGLFAKAFGRGGGIAGKGISGLKPVPVFVTNKGFGPGGPGGEPTPVGKVPGAVKTAGKVALAVSGPEIAAVAAPLIVADILNRRSKLSKQAHALNDVLPAGRENLARQLDEAVKAGSPDKLRKVAAAIELTAQDMKGMGSAAKSASPQVQAVADNARELAKAQDRAGRSANGLAKSISRVTTNGEAAARKIHRLHDEIKDLPTNVRVNIIARAVHNFGKGGKDKFGPNFSTGGLVPGHGNRDSVKANLTPGEYVLRKGAVQKLGVKALDNLNKRTVGKLAARNDTFMQPFGRLDEDVSIGSQAGLRSALHHAEIAKRGPGKLVTTNTSPFSSDPITFHPSAPRQTIEQVAINVTTPAGAVPDGRFMAIQAARELARRA